MRIKTTHGPLNLLLEKALQREVLNSDDFSLVLDLHQKDHIDALFRTARELREIYFDNKVFLYGFLYINTHCRNNCNFCFYRRSNSNSVRYRKELPQIEEAALELKELGVHLIDLTMGEDPELFEGDDSDFESLIRIVKIVKERTDLPIMVSPGVVPSYILQALTSAGASWYACYQETHQTELFKKLRPGQSYQERLDSKQLASHYGLLTEEGILVGGGERSTDIAHSIDIISALKIDQVRAMNFVPQKDTPMENHPPPDPLRELLIIALMRLVFPDKLIPATLDVEGLQGLKQRLDAGANVVTSIVPPSLGLAGVAQSSLDIEDARRTTISVLPVIESCGLSVAGPEDFKTWMDQRRELYSNKNIKQ